MVNVREFKSDLAVTQCLGNQVMSRQPSCYEQIQPISAKPLQVTGSTLDPISRCPVSPDSSCSTMDPLQIQGHRISTCVPSMYSDGPTHNNASNQLITHHYTDPPTPEKAAKIISKPNPPPIKGMGIKLEQSKSLRSSSEYHKSSDAKPVCMVPNGCLDNYRIVPDAPMITKSNPEFQSQTQMHNKDIPRVCYYDQLSLKIIDN